MRVMVLGAGAMGCLFGAALFRGGAEVLLVDVDEAHLAAIRNGGLELDTRAGIERLPLAASRPAEACGPFDLVLVFTKTFQTRTALQGVSHAIGQHTHLLSLQNGLGNDRRLAEWVDPARVLVGACMLPCDLLGPGRVRSHGEGHSSLYPAFGGDPAIGQEAALRLAAGGLETRVDPAIREVIWAKAIFNAIMNPLCALTRRTPGFLGAHEPSLALVAAGVAEGVACAKANGVWLEAQPILALTRTSMSDHADHEASMLQDVKAGRRTEIDAITGAIVDLAREQGLASPVLETLWRLIKLEEAKLGILSGPGEASQSPAPSGQAATPA